MNPEEKGWVKVNSLSLDEYHPDIRRSLMLDDQQTHKAIQNRENEPVSRPKRQAQQAPKKKTLTPQEKLMWKRKQQASIDMLRATGKED